MNENAVTSFGAFYDAWFDRVYNYARHRTGSPVRADEIVSDTFSRVFRGWSGFDPAKGDRRTWLFSIAFRAVADHYRSEKSGVVTGLDQAPEPAESGAGPAEQVEVEQEKRLIAAALRDLEDQPREIVSLKFYGGLTNRAIAKLLGLTESNVAVILFRSIRKLRKNLSGVEADHG